MCSGFLFCDLPLHIPCHYFIKFCLFIINLAYALLSRVSFVSLHPNILVLFLNFWYGILYHTKIFIIVELKLTGLTLCDLFFSDMYVYVKKFFPYSKVLDFQNKNILNIWFSKVAFGSFCTLVCD